MLREQSRQKCKTLRYIVNQSNIHIHLYKTGCRVMITMQSVFLLSEQKHWFRCPGLVELWQTLRLQCSLGLLSTWYSTLTGPPTKLQSNISFDRLCLWIRHTFTVASFWWAYTMSQHLLRPELHSFSPRSYIGDGSVGRCVKSSRALPKDSQWG